MESAASITVASWNIHAIRGAGQARLTRIVDALSRHDVDVVALQEVALDGFSTRLSEELAGIGLTEFHLGSMRAERQDEARPKRYGSAIASRLSLYPRSSPAGMRWPQLSVAADVMAPCGLVTVVSAHIPNGSGNGWEKVYHFEALADELGKLPGPTVLAGDFNEPKVLAPKRLSFGANRHGRLEGTFRDLCGIRHERIRWQEAVGAVLWPSPAAPEGRWRGMHVADQTGAPLEPTHAVNGRFDRYFDHILTGRGLRGLSVIYDHQVRRDTAPASDHSLVVARIARTQ